MLPRKSGICHFFDTLSAGKNVKVLPALFSIQTSAQYDRSATKEIACNLELLPDEGFLFSAVPPKFKGVGTFPVRAMAKVQRAEG